MLKDLLNLMNYRFNPFAIPVLLVSILIFTIGIFVFRQNRRSSLNISFFLISLTTGFWLFTVSFVYLCRIPDLAIYFYRYFTFFGVVNIMPSLLFFSSAWLGDIRRKRNFIIANYLISFIFYLLAVFTDKMISPDSMRYYFWGYYPIYKPLSIPFLVFFFVQVVITVVELYKAYKEETIPIKKMSKKIILLASLIGFTAPIDFIPKLWRLPWVYPIGYISMFIYISLVAYSIVRYRAFDIETVIHKTVMWLFSFSFMIIPVLLLFRLLYPSIKNSTLLETIFLVFVFLFSILYLRLIQPRIDHVFQRQRATMEGILGKFIGDLVHLKGMNQLIQRIEDTIADSLYPQHIGIFIYNETKDTYKLANVINTAGDIVELGSDHPFLMWLGKHDDIVYKEFVDLDPAYAGIKEAARSYFNLTGATLAIPLILNEKILGIINLSKKANLKRYTAVDLQFLDALKNQASIAISNSMLYQNIEEQVKQRTDELVEVQKQLVQAEKLATVGTLAGGVAHEINNPLTAILTNVQMLLAPGEAQADLESLQLIEEATKRCRTIVQKLMAYAKKPLETAEVKEVDMLDAVEKVLSFLTYQMEQDNIKITLDAKKGDYPVMGNHNEMEQVITNILINAKDAIRHHKRSGEIHISLTKNDDWVKVTVKDDGAGIPKNILPKIFDPFFTTKEIGKGLGLGLSICHSIVEKHSGTITVDSEPGKGSRFTVQLPKAVMAKIP